MSVRRVRILQALVRPSLWFGCDPTALMIVSGISALVGLGGGIGFREPLLMPLGGFLFWAGRRGLLGLSQKDPQYPWIYLRAAQYKHVYAARSRWDVAPRRPRRWS